VEMLNGLDVWCIPSSFKRLTDGSWVLRFKLGLESLDLGLHIVDVLFRILIDDDLKNRGEKKTSWTSMEHRVNPPCCLHFFLPSKKSKLRVTVGVPLFLIIFARCAHWRAFGLY